MSAPTSSFDLLLDTSGLNCPEPVMMLHQAIRRVKAGEVIKVVATDPSTQRDIPKFCSFLGHKLITQNEADKQFIYYIEKSTE